MNQSNVFVKIFVLACVFSVIMAIGKDFLYWGNEDTNLNERTFSSATDKSNIIWNAGLAITLSVWTRHKQLSETPINVYDDVLDISYIVANKQIARDKIISTNMIIVNDYLNVLKTDVKWLLASWNDRATTLDLFLDQLEYRLTNAEENIKTLKLQGKNLQDSRGRSMNEIKILKDKIDSSFKNYDSESTIDNLDMYLDAQEQYRYSHTYLVFVSEFIKKYETLNAYNKRFISALKANRDALIKNTKVVIPDSGSDFLKKLDLIWAE